MMNDQDLKDRVDRLLSLKEPPNLRGIGEATPGTALHIALKEAKHWHREYNLAAEELIATEDRREALQLLSKRFRRMQLIALFLFVGWSGSIAGFFAVSINPDLRLMLNITRSANNR